MANTSCSLNIRCIFSTKERAPMLSPELRERLWPFLGGIAKQNGITPLEVAPTGTVFTIVLLSVHVFTLWSVLDGLL